MSYFAERMREYTDMLEQAQGTIQSLQEPREDGMSLLDVRNYSTDEDDDDDDKKTASSSSSSLNNVDLYRHRIIRKRASNPEVATPIVSTKKQSWLPQKGLRILLNDYRSF